MIKCNQRRAEVSSNIRTVSGDVIISWLTVGSYPVQEWDATGGGGPWNSCHWLRISWKSQGLLHRGGSIPWPVLKPTLNPHTLVFGFLHHIIASDKEIFDVEKCRNYEALSTWWWNVEEKSQAFESEESKLKSQFRHLTSETVLPYKVRAVVIFMGFVECKRTFIKFIVGLGLPIYLLSPTILSRRLAKWHNRDVEKCWSPEVLPKLKSVCFSMLGGFFGVKILGITKFVVFL